jgi:hypothetical protein
MILTDGCIIIHVWALGIKGYRRTHGVWWRDTHDLVIKVMRGLRYFMVRNGRFYFYMKASDHNE